MFIFDDAVLIFVYYNSNCNPYNFRDGCSKSGLFVALCLIWDKLELDDELDVFQAVRHVQSRRPEFMTNGVSLS